MADGAYKKKLIEVALPLDAINAESAREKSIRHGHPSTLHLWWARRPLAACRAVLFAQLVDDPSAHPEKFPTEEAQDAERQRLFAIIEDLVKWENSTNESVLEAARAEIRRSCNGNPPPILDPFAGGGSIPLEAQRLGLEAHASDLNPVAVLINKALIEIPPRWADHPPVHPEAENRTRWHGAEGLAEDVRRYGKWMRDEAERRIGHLYPKATLPDGSKANVIAWIWARTVTCPNPACGATMPLVRSFWLSKKKGKEAWVKPVVEGKGVRFEIAHGKEGPEPVGTVGRAGPMCLICDTAVQFNHVRAEGRARRIGCHLMATVAEGAGQRVYLSGTEGQVQAAAVPKPDGAPSTELPEQALGFRIQAYGMTRHSDLFTNRQLTSLTLFSDLVAQASAKVVDDATMAGFPGYEAREYGVAVATYLALTVNKMADRNSMLCAWEPIKTRLRGTFQRQALPMAWDFAEANIFGGAGGDFGTSLLSLWEVVDHLCPSGLPQGHATQIDARGSVKRPGVTATDPPYYDNIGYADLSDFFYVWLRRSLKSAYPGMFETVVTPKADELIATPYRHNGSKEGASSYFERGFVDVFAHCRRNSPEGFPLSLFYAFKQSEASLDGAMGSTGWSTMLEGLAAAGWLVTATWPMRTEMGNRMIASGTNALASSVLLACRPRPDTAGVTDRQGLIRALQAELPGPLRELQKANIAPVDLRQAAIGPGMAVFSRFAKVVEPDGSSMRVRTALGLINQVLDQVLDEQQEDLDAETRWAVQWFSQFYGDEGPYGVAEQLAVSMNIAVRGLVDSGILRSGGGKARLLARNELRDDWDPLTDARTSAWEAAQHLVKRLEADGEAGAGRLLNQLEHKGGGLAESAQLLAYRLYTLCEQARPAEAGPYNALVASWPEIHRLARETGAPATVAEQQSWET